jgi:hypothetical protein
LGADYSISASIATRCIGVAAPALGADYSGLVTLALILVGVAAPSAFGADYRYGDEEPDMLQDVAAPVLGADYRYGYNFFHNFGGVAASVLGVAHRMNAMPAGGSAVLPPRFRGRMKLLASRGSRKRLTRHVWGQK